MKNSQLKEIGLDFTVSKRPLYRIDESLVVDGHGGLEVEKEFKETQWFSTVNDSTLEDLGVVGNQYTVTQNEQIMETLQEIAKENGYTISHSGPLNGGKQCFAQLRLNESKIVGPDELIKYVVATWGHDGKHGVRIGYGNRVVSCSNQFYQFHNKAQYKLRHNSTIEESLRAIPLIMNEYKDFEDDMYRKFEEWTKVPIWTDRKIMDFRNGLWKDLLDIDKKLSIEEAREKYSTRKWNAAMDLQQSINTEMQVHGDTLWGLFNGVTHFVNHKKSVPNRPFGRDESLIVGGGARIANKAYKMIDAFAETL